MQFLKGNFETLEDYLVYPAQEPLPDIKDAPQPPFVTYLDQMPEALGEGAFYPSNVVNFDGPHVIRGQSIIYLRIFPVQFNPVTRHARVYSKITVRILFERTDTEEADDFSSLQPERLRTLSFEKALTNLVLNPFVLRPEAEPEVAPSEPKNSLLIITHPNFLPAANTLARWKLKKGIQTTVKTTNETGNTSQAIKQYIQNAYNTWNPPPTYLLLIGDAEFVPTNYKTQHRYHKSLIGTDLYYATVDGNDYFADIHMGRLSVDTATEATNRVNGIINYEKAIVRDNGFYQNATMAGYFQDKEWWENSYDGIAARRFAQTSEDIALYLNQNYQVQRLYFTEQNVQPKKWKLGGWNFGGLAGEPGDNIPQHLEKPGFAWAGNPNNITAAINAGRFLVTHRDHGHRSQGWDEPAYSISNVQALANGNRLPIVWSINCETGWFDNETDKDQPQTSKAAIHFSEAWERNPNGGAVGIIAATRVSYSGYNDRLAWGWMDAIWPDFEDNHQGEEVEGMGAVLNYGKLYLANHYPSNNTRKMEFEIFHWFGDPTMDMWTAIPRTFQVFHAPKLSMGTSSIDITVNQPNALISIYKEDSNNGEILGKGRSRAGATTITLSKPLVAGDKIYVTVTRRNHRPYEGTIIVGDGTGPNTFVGTWINNDEKTRGMTRIIISRQGNTMTVHGYGKCHPTNCDWGIVSASYTGNPFKVVYAHGFKTNTLTIKLVRENALHIHSANIFHDGTNRDYEADYYMHRR